MEALRASFRPEFINRIDEIVIFNPLGKEQLERIVGLLLKGVEKLLCGASDNAGADAGGARVCCCGRATILRMGRGRCAEPFSG